jgi:hypothetical protein
LINLNATASAHGSWCGGLLKSEVAPNEKQLSEEFADVVAGISNETLFRRARCAV